jgi:hypothetical protein
MTTTHISLTLLLCLLVVSCKTPTTQEAQDYLQGKWRLDREAKDHGYLEGMTVGDDLFMVVSGRTLTITLIKQEKIVEVSTNTIGVIRSDQSGVIKVWSDKTPGTPIPDCTFTRIDDDHASFAMYDFWVPLKRDDQRRYRRRGLAAR